MTCGLRSVVEVAGVVDRMCDAELEGLGDRRGQVGRRTLVVERGWSYELDGTPGASAGSIPLGGGLGAGSVSSPDPRTLRITLTILLCFTLRSLAVVVREFASDIGEQVVIVGRVVVMSHFIFTIALLIRDDYTGSQGLAVRNRKVRGTRYSLSNILADSYIDTLSAREQDSAVDSYDRKQRISGMANEK